MFRYTLISEKNFHETLLDDQALLGVAKRGFTCFFVIWMCHVFWLCTMTLDIYRKKGHNKFFDKIVDN